MRMVAAIAAGSLLSGCVAALPLAAGMGSAGAGLGFAGLIGHSDAKGSMPRATAQALGQNMNPDDVKVSDTHISAHTARWTADTPLGRYECSADDNVRRAAYCSKK